MGWRVLTVDLKLSGHFTLFNDSFPFPSVREKVKCKARWLLPGAPKSLHTPLLNDQLMWLRWYLCITSTPYVGLSDKHLMKIRNIFSVAATRYHHALPVCDGLALNEAAQSAWARLLLLWRQDRTLVESGGLCRCLFKTLQLSINRYGCIICRDSSDVKWIWEM